MVRCPDAERWRPGAARRRACRGSTLLEALLSVTVLLVGLAILCLGVLGLKRARIEAETRDSCTAALEEAVSVLRAMDLTDAYLAYAAGGGGPPFSAPYLQDPDDPTQAARVQVEFFTDETEADEALGLPADLDADGVVGNGDVGRLGPDGEVVARLIPVRLRLPYRRADGALGTAVWNTVLTMDLGGD